MYLVALAMGRGGKWFRRAGLVLGAILFLGLSGGISSFGGASYLHPALLALSTQHPTQNVEIIVQKDGSDKHLEKMVAALGGEVTADLWIVNGFAALLPAGELPALASAGGVRWISPNGTFEAAGKKTDDGLTAANLTNNYVRTIGADKVWAGSPAVTGLGVGVGVIDSGVTDNSDFSDAKGNSRLVVVSAGTGGTSFNEKDKGLADDYGHGTHVAGIVAGNGANSGGAYMGVAPQATLYSLKVADGSGQGTTSGVLQAAEWLLTNHSQYNIRVVNMSFSSAIPQSYNVDPIDAAVELLWANGMVVVVSVGNSGPNGAITAPANDPFVIAVGASDIHGTDKRDDDTLAVFSSFGAIETGIAKPDIVAPGRHIISVLANKHASLVTKHSPNLVSKSYFMMSGTSMASPMVAGAAALLLQMHPRLSPNQVKGCLMDNGAKPVAGSQAKYLAIENMSQWDCKNATANQNVNPSQLALRVVSQIPGTVLNWGNVNWGNVNWGNVNWGNVNWGNVNWGNVNWGNVNWGNVNWGNVNWGYVPDN